MRSATLAHWRGADRSWILGHMYRNAPAPSAHCPACGSIELTDETRFEPSAGHASVFFRVAGDARTRETHACRVDRARICLACGHVALGLSPAALVALKTKLGALRAVPPDRVQS